jgi:uncharacterized protein (DUF2236 family)
MEENSLPARPGFFAPRGVFWEVSRENVLMLGAGSAILLQVAHPLVAAGVDDHSDFRQHPLKRLYRTLRALERLICGDSRAALRMARHLDSLHSRVRGTLKDETPVFPAGTPYAANDPDLLLWVYATLVQSTVVTHDQFLPPLSAAGRAQFYQTSRQLARLAGVPESVLPRNYAAFSAYYESMLEGETLTVTPSAARIAEAVLDPRIPLLPRFVGKWNRLVTAALLPPAIRERYRLPWDEEEERKWRVFRERVRKLLAVTPGFLRAGPGAQWAELRWKWNAWMGKAS